MELKALNRGEVLWRQGEPAENIAIIESGKLGITIDKRLVGILWKGMVVGEAAILTAEGHPQKRTATVFALEDDTMIAEYPATRIKDMYEDGNSPLAEAVLVTLVGQIVRDCLLIMYATQDETLVYKPIKGMMEGLMRAFNQRIQNPQTFSEFLFTCRILFVTRDYTESMRRQLHIDGIDREQIKRASEAIAALFKGNEALAALQDFLHAEHEKSSVIEQTEIGSAAGLYSFLIRD